MFTKLFGFLLLISKVHEEIINDWHYRKTNIDTKSEMNIKYGQYLYEINMSTKTVMNENCTINDPKKGHFQDIFTNLYTFFLVVLTQKVCMACKQWISGFVWHQKIMVTQFQPRAMILSSPGKGG